MKVEVQFTKRNANSLRRLYLLLCTFAKAYRIAEVTLEKLYLSNVWSEICPLDEVKLRTQTTLIVSKGHSQPHLLGIGKDFQM